MSSTFEADKTGADNDEACFLAKVTQALDSSLMQLPNGIEESLDGVRHNAMLQVLVRGSESSAVSGRLAASLESSEPQIPESVRLRLDGIRTGAMQRASAAQQKGNAASTANGWWWSRWAPRGFAVPASAFASICMLVTTLAIFNLSKTPEIMPLLVDAQNSLVLASEEEIELYENLEFYQWLAENDW